MISFISIGIITLIGVFTFPLLGKIEDRKISVLKFFNHLSISQIHGLIQRGVEFQTEFASNSREVNAKEDKSENWEENEQMFSSTNSEL